MLISRYTRVIAIVLLAAGAMPASAAETTPAASRREPMRQVAPPLGSASPVARVGPRPRPSAPTSSCVPERNLALDPKSQTLHVGLKTYPQTLKLADKEVVLTFDDGPDPDTTPKILAALKQACVHATFFLIGRHAAKYPALARRERDEGHSVGHHSNTHPTFTLRGFDTKSAEEDIDAGIAADDAAIYPDSGDKPSDRPRVPFFRFPGFADTPELLAFLDARHIAVFGTDLWAADWLQMTPNHERLRVLGLLQQSAHHNGILLFHDTRRSTGDMLPAFLRDLKRGGYTVVRLRYAPGADAAALTPPYKGWFPETERIIARLRVPITPNSHHIEEMIEPPADDGHTMEGMQP